MSAPPSPAWSAGPEEAPAVGLVSLGCAKNLVDSEVLAGALVRGGFRVTADIREADLVVVNTCGFIGEARKESIETLLAVSRLKDEGRLQGLVAYGCLAQRNGAELAPEMAEVDAWVGVFDPARVVGACRDLFGGRPLAPFAPTALPDGGPFPPDAGRIRLTAAHSAYLRISDGCNHPCTFCAIPSMRGRHRSVPREPLLAEARRLAAEGVVELNLIAQDTTYWGFDLDGRFGFASLLRDLAAIASFRWIRVLYAHPAHLSDAMIDALASDPARFVYLDMPLQHIEDRMLRRMGRQVGRAATEALLGRVRERCPRMGLRTTFIAGFPGETEAQFETLRTFAASFPFDRLGVFPYSPEPGTSAERLPAPLPLRERRERARAVQAAHRDRLRAAHRALRGSRETVLVDAVGAAGRAVGRTGRDAPDVDARVLLRGGVWRAGTFREARIRGTRGVDLVADAE